MDLQPATEGGYVKVDQDQIERAVSKRVQWASTALAVSAEELRELDSQRADVFAAEAERVARLSEVSDARTTRRGAWT